MATSHPVTTTNTHAAGTSAATVQHADYASRVGRDEEAVARAENAIASHATGGATTNTLVHDEKARIVAESKLRHDALKTASLEGKPLIATTTGGATVIAQGPVVEPGAVVHPVSTTHPTSATHPVAGTHHSVDTHHHAGTNVGTHTTTHPTSTHVPATGITSHIGDRVLGNAVTDSIATGGAPVAGNAGLLHGGNTVTQTVHQVENVAREVISGGTTTTTGTHGTTAGLSGGQIISETVTRH